MHSKLIKLTICSLLFLFGSSAAYSCSCNYPEVHERLKSSDIVFLGRVLDIAPLFVKDQRKDEWWGIEAIASLKVEKQYKGNKVSKIKVYWMRDIFGPGDCGELPLVKGERYLIFSDRKKKGRYIVDQDCSWSTFAKDSKEDVKKLDLSK
jgi:hypothetical protein